MRFSAQILLVYKVRIFLPTQDDLDWAPLTFPLVLVQRRQDVVCGEGVEVVLGGQPVGGEARVDLAVRDLRSQWRPRVKRQRGRDGDGERSAERNKLSEISWKLI